MLKKRIAVIIVLSLVSTTVPFLYQYIIEPRVDGANVTLEINSIRYNGDESGEDATAFSVYLTLRNDESNEVIVSPLQTDVYYREGDNYRLIGEFSTAEDYTIPANSSVSSEILGSEAERTDDNKKTHNINKNIRGILKVSKKPGFIDGSNAALVSLINDGTIDLRFRGNAQYGPVSIPFNPQQDIKLNAEVWDRDILLKDLFPYQEDSGSPQSEKSFVMHTEMQNPSGLPLVLDDFQLDLYNTTTSATEPLDPKNQVGWGLKSKDIATSIDPDNTTQQINEIFLDNYINYHISPTEDKDVFFGFNFTNPDVPSKTDNIEWFMTKLLDNRIMKGVTIKGPAEVIIGQRNKGFKVDMTEENNHLEIDDINFHQQSLNNPKKMLENFTVGGLRLQKMQVDTKNEEMTLDIQANLTLQNPYRFEYSLDDFTGTYRHESGEKFAESLQGVSATVGSATREFSEDEQEWITRASKTGLPLNLTTTYDTSDAQEGVYKVIEDLGGDPSLLNLTNPFWLKRGTQEYNQNPLSTMNYLVSQDVNPLTLLNEVSVLAQSNVTQPLGAQFFGNSDRDPSETDTQAEEATDMPYVYVDGSENFTLASHEYFADVPTISNWDDYPYSATENEGIHSPNQYQVLREGDLDGSGDYFPHDTDNDVDQADLTGGIFEYDEERSGDPSEDNNGIQWRVYEDGSSSDMWGHWYDVYGGSNGDRGYVMGTHVDDDAVMFSQNFTLNEDLFADNDGYADNIENVTLSTSYRYLDPEQTDDDAGLAFSWFDEESEEYSYDLLDSGVATSGDIFKGRDGWKLPYTEDNEWDHFSVDLTDLFKERLDDYVENDYDEDYLKGEVSFATEGTNTVYFDDIVLNIQYTDYDVENSEGSLSVEDLFEYLQSVNSEEGNMFNLFEQMADEKHIDADDFWKYMGDDLEEGGPGEEGMDFFKFLEFSNFSFSAMTDLLSNDYQKLDIGEPINFFDALQQSKYETLPPGYTGEDFIETEYGPRLLADDYWTIEDPYAASRTIMEKLYENIFIGDTANKFSENELWYIFENLGVSVPDICNYLLSNGWTGSDIFDVFEALGFASETKESYDEGERSGGELETEVHIEIDIAGGLATDDTDETFEFDMGRTLLNGIEELIDKLAYSGQKDIVKNRGEPQSGQEYIFDGTVTVAGFIDVAYDVTITPEEFLLHIWADPTSGAISPPDSGSFDIPNDYYSSTDLGFKDAGVKELAKYMRINYKFDGETFIQQSGDIMSLFQFLDDYYFGEHADSGIDYNSFTLLNAFNVSSRDFIDIITGYDRSAGEFDTNGNGKADDWIAPSYYGAGERDTLQGWGTNFMDNRLYWNTDEYEDLGQENGKIIWSDTSDFAESNDYHDDGEIDVGDDEISLGAPPIVDLIDMLVWLGESGRLDPDDLMQWLVGELDSEYYRLVDPYADEEVAPSDYNEGLTNQKVWRMFRETSLNATGFFDWMENRKSVNSFRFLKELGESTDNLDPLDLIFFATSPNMIRFFDDSLAFMYHDALDSQGTDDPDDLFWDFFSTDYFDEGEFFELLNRSNFNIFEIFTNLEVDPASWLRKLNLEYDLLPIEVIKRMKKLDPGPEYIEFDKTRGKTVLNVTASMKITYQGIELKEITSNIAEDKVLTADEHFEDFILEEYLRGDNFVID